MFYHSAGNVQDAFGLRNGRAKIQRGISHRIPCPVYRPGEALEGVLWYKGSSLEDPSTVRLISRLGSTLFPTSDRYEFASDDISLVIRYVEEGDEGRYLCQVVPQSTINRVEVIDLRVIGKFLSESW